MEIFAEILEGDLKKLCEGLIEVFIKLFEALNDGAKKLPQVFLYRK